MATLSTVPNLTLSQDARLHKFIRLPGGWKYLRAGFNDSGYDAPLAEKRSMTIFTAAAEAS